LAGGTNRKGAAVGPFRVGAIDGHRALGTGEGADNAGGVGNSAAVRNAQVAGAAIADPERAAVHGRTGAVHRNHALGTRSAAEINVVSSSDGAAVAHSQRAVAAACDAATTTTTDTTTDDNIARGHFLLIGRAKFGAESTKTVPLQEEPEYAMQSESLIGAM